MTEETNAESQSTGVEVKSVDSLLSDKASRKQLAFGKAPTKNIHTTISLI